MSAPRAWFMFRYFGCRRVDIMAGGFPAWKAAGFPTEKSPGLLPEKKIFNAQISGREDWITPLKGVQDRVSRIQTDGIDAKITDVVLDARSQARFEGTAAEPRAGLKAGHMPFSYNLPFGELIQEGKGVLKEEKVLKQYFMKAGGVDAKSRVITTCGSGMTACTLLLALDVIGNKNVSLFDGSWTEYASSPRSVIVGGPAEPVGAAKKK